MWSDLNGLQEFVSASAPLSTSGLKQATDMSLPELQQELMYALVARARVVAVTFCCV